MKPVTRRAFIAAAAACPLIVANAEPALAAKKKKSKKKTAEVGETVVVKTKKGTLKIAVDGCESSQALTSDYSNYDQVGDGNSVVAVMLVVKNVNVELGDYEQVEYQRFGIDFTDADGVSLTPFDSGNDYKGYSCALAGYLTALEGQTDREAVFVQVPAGTESIISKLGKTKVTVPITYL